MSTATLEAPAVQSRTRLAAPEPGIYPNIPFATYSAWDAVNNSLLSKLIDQSPLHAKDSIDKAEEDEEHYLIGRALHTLVLEEENFAAEFPISTGCVATKKDGKACENAGKYMAAGLWYCGTHRPRDAEEPSQFLTPDQEKLVRAMKSGMLDHEAARRFIYTKDDAQNELSIIWIDRGSGVKCKARIDMARPSWGAIGDLKTTRSAGPNDFPAAIGNYGYYRQGAFYLAGAKEVGMNWAEHFFLFPVEKERPFASASYQLAADAIELGRMELARGLKIVAHCQKTNDWFGYESQLELISVDRWKAQRIIKNLEK